MCHKYFKSGKKNPDSEIIILKMSWMVVYVLELLEKQLTPNLADSFIRSIFK